MGDPARLDEENRIRIIVALPFAALDRLKLQRELDRIGTR
jgi:arsenate reductase (thioredoxin)